uniref:PEHE domain-containing protein n=1 Tax=Clastoptera arizonana TaxID=38151 RepID=A0A1B6D0U1_9HEMI
MGLKHASVRHPNVVVMAPALTEAGQSHNFKLPASTISSPVSPISIAVISDGKAIDSPRCKFSKLNDLIKTEPIIQLGMNGDLTTIKSNQCVINGSDNLNEQIHSSKINAITDQLQLLENNIDKNSDIGQSNKEVNNTLNNLNKNQTSEISSEASEYSLLQIGGFMMNKGYQSMGDQDDNMGLNKSSTENSNLDPNFLKMDQLFKNLESSIHNSDLGGGGDFVGQNVEDLLQVINNMESQTNDIEEQLDAGQTGDSEGIFHMSDSADITSSLSTFERDFFNDDMMNMCDENLGDSSLVMGSKETLINEKVDDVLKRQFQIERKCEWLIRRLRKFQVRSMGKQASEEVTGLLEHVNTILAESSTKNSTLSAVAKSSDCDKKKAMSTSAMNTLMRRLDQSSQQQAVAVATQKASCKYFGSGSSDVTQVTSVNNGLRSTSLPGSIIPKLNIEVQQEMEQVSGQLYAHLKTVESGIDSDVTESSSGAESCDEMQTFNNPHQQQLTISKRAEWIWAQDRATIGYKWTWLQAQISDLEYRIRQHTEINRQIRTAKGGVVLGVEDQKNTSDNSVVVNGYHGTLPGASVRSDDAECEDSVSRTRPLIRSSFRKRKLLQTHGLHLVSKKAARPTTLRCGCQPPIPTCALCTGRQDPTQPREQLSLLTVNERIASIDPSYHSVLSFPSDVSQSIHFDALMKTSNWQQKAHRSYLKSQPVTSRSVETFNEGIQERLVKKPLVDHHRKKYSLKKTTANALSERYQDDEMYTDTQSRFDEDSSSSSTPYTVVSGTTRPSPVPSPSSSTLSLLARGEILRRKRENSYDIDNIVIPYSVAASTRLTQVLYKEILTPKWRIVSEDPFKLETKNNGVVRRPSHENDLEDLSEESVILRHERSEQEERKKFSSYLKLPNSMARARSNRRADSHHSSGGNTPDPMSPIAQDHTYGGSVSPMTSPPATPLPADVENNMVVVRRRTISLSRFRDREDSRCTTPTENLHDEVVAPYELRVFPLPDDVYEKMQRAMPPGYPFKTQPSINKLSSKDSEIESRPTTPDSDSTESADTFIDEDPDDPEWTTRISTFDRSKR